MVLAIRTLAGALLAAPAVALTVSAAVAPVASTPTATADVPVAAASPVPLTQEYCDAHYGQPVGEVFTWRAFTFQTYLGDAACETHRQGTYLASGVSVDAAGDLVISARRHCTAGPVAEDTPVTEAPCEGDRAQYSVGRLRLADFRVPATDFEWGFEARLPERSAPGARSALWLVNLEQVYCAPEWGELDVLEWYSSRPELPEAATHATCTDATYASWHHKPATWDWGTRGRTGFHRWAVRKETTAGPGGRTVTLSYLFDGRVHAVDTCQEKLPSATCAAVLDTAWTAILQTAVFGDDSGPFLRPSDHADFPTQELVIRDMWVEELQELTGRPPPPRHPWPRSAPTPAHPAPSAAGAAAP